MLQRFIVLLLVASIFLPASSTTAQDIPVVKIGEVQGVVTDGMPDANILKSPYDGERVIVQGVVTNPIAINASGRIVYGFFLQEQPENSDNNPNTSDAIQVLAGASLKLGDYAVAVGDIITIVGEVEEYYDLTRLREVDFISLDGHIEDLDDAVPPLELQPPAGGADEVYRYYERIENMRVTVPAGSVVVSPTHLFTSSNDTEVYVMRVDHPVAERDNLYGRRVFRDIHALDDGSEPDNLYRISIEGNILKAMAGDYTLNLPTYDTFDVFTTPLTGNIVYAYGRYTLQIDALPEIDDNIEPIDNDPPLEVDRLNQFSIASLNIENLYDFYDDPFDREDNPSSTQLNYVPRSLEEYQRKITKAALQITDLLHAPDIIGLQEVEDQDVCENGGQIYGTCSDTVNDADGLPDVLQDLAAEIESRSGIIYNVAIDRDSADDRGIAQAFMYRADRVELVEPTEDHPVFGLRTDDSAGRRYAQNYQVSNPKALNASFGLGLDVFPRAPLVGLFRIYQTAGDTSTAVDIYFANNHLKSNPEEFIALREAGALYNLSFVEAVQAIDPGAYFIVGGDLNSFRESTEIALLDTLLFNLSEVVPPESDYTYTYAGQAQSLDYIFMTDSLANLLVDGHIVHANADYSYDYIFQADSPFGAADHDPLVAIFSFPQ